MMKNNILLIALLTIFFIGCYEDKGNYDYTTREEITVAGLEEKYPVVALKDTLDICPTIDHSETYDYMWLMYSKQEIVSKFDTIGREQRLVWPVTKSEGDYKLYLKVISRNDGYARMFESLVRIVSSFSDGWYVAKDKDGRADVDYFPLDKVRVPDILEQSIGKNMPGEVQNLTLLTGFSYTQPDGVTVWGEHMFVLNTTEDSWLVRCRDMSLQRNFSEMFFDEVPQEKPGVTIYRNNVYGMLTDKQVYFVNPATSGQLGEPLNYGKEMTMGKSALTIGAGACFYDQKNKRFLGTDYWGWQAAVFPEEGKNGYIPPVSANSTGCSMLYMGINRYDSENFYAVMENAGEKYVFTMLTPSINEMGAFNPILSVDTLRSELKINEATLFAVGSSLPYIYYNDKSGNFVHFYDMRTRREIPEVFSFPGEQVTFIKALYFDPITSWQGDPEEKFDKLVIATEKNGQYTVYLFELLAGKPVPGKEPEKLTGEGTVRAVSRLRPSMSGYSMDCCSCNF